MNVWIWILLLFVIGVLLILCATVLGSFLKYLLIIIGIILIIASIVWVIMRLVKQGQEGHSVQMGQGQIGYQSIPMDNLMLQ